MKKVEFSQEELKRWVHYDPDTGLFTNIMDRGDVKGASKKCPIGKILGTIDNGYLLININGYPYFSHQLAWLYMTGYWPVGIDHKNRNKTCNIWSNLREANQSLNSKNRSKNKNNTSNVTGVYWNNYHNKWKAQIIVEGKSIFLGLFKDKQGAIDARRGAENEYGFTNE